MHAIQYEIALPADYNMAIIERRVATRGPRLDEFPGLGLKAYAVPCSPLRDPGVRRAGSDE